MSPQEQGRFCGSCCKTVVDFSMMTDKEMVDYISKATHHVCGRFSNDQLNKPLPVTNNKKRYSFTYLWNVLLATLLITKANAQVKPVKPKKPTTVIEPARATMGMIVFHTEKVAVVPSEVMGAVFDSATREPLPGASIRVKKTTRGVAADSAGNFSILLEKKDERTLEFSAVGYESQTMVMDNKVNWRNLQVFLKPVIGSLKAVSIVAPALTGMAGGVSYGYRISKAEKIKRNINDWMPKKDIKVYPNPVVRGNNIWASLALQQPGEYKLELMNADGQVLAIQPVIVQTKEQVITIPTEQSWSAGIYWIRMSAPKIKNVYQAKVLLQ